jgi:hypothetical protein
MSDNIDNVENDFRMEDKVDIERYEIQLIIINEFGEFRGIKAQVESGDYDKIVKLSKNFYSSGGFELSCEDGSYVILPPDLVQKSILKIDKKLIKEEKNVQE